MRGIAGSGNLVINEETLRLIHRRGSDYQSLKRVEV